MAIDRSQYAGIAQALGCRNFMGVKPPSERPERFDPKPLPTLDEFKRLARALKDSAGCKMCHAYESLAREYGFKTYASLLEAYKQSEDRKRGLKVMAFAERFEALHSLMATVRVAQGQPPSDEFRIHPDDFAELLELSDGKFARDFSFRTLSRFDSVKLVLDANAQRLPRKPIAEKSSTPLADDPARA